MSSAIATRPAPSHGIRYVSAFKHIKPVPIQPIIAAKRGIQDFDILKYLNTGNSGTVYLARDVNTSKEVALKIIPKAGTNKDDAMNEQRVQKYIEAQGNTMLLSITASFHDTRNYYIATEYMPGGDMALELARVRFFDEDRARFYVAEMIVAVEQLKKHRIIHRDIKPANLLIDARGHLRLTDYGFSKKFDAPEGYEDLDTPDASFTFEVDGNCESGTFFTDVPTPTFTTNERVGTPHFMSPQRSAGKAYDDKEDLWSVGVVLYVMLTGRLPFGDGIKDPFDISWSIQHKQLEFHPTDLVSDDAKILLIGMLTKDTRTRLTIEQVKCHNFFKGLDWVRVAYQEYDAPWIPYSAPLPKVKMANPPDIVGTPLDDWLDPLPDFAYTSPELELPKPKPAQEPVKVEASPLKKFGTAVGKLLTPKKKQPSPPLVVSPRAQVQEPTLVQPFNPTNGKGVNALIERTNGVEEEDVLQGIDKLLKDLETQYENGEFKATPSPKPRLMEEEELVAFRDVENPQRTAKPQPVLIQAPISPLSPRRGEQLPAFRLDSPNPKKPTINHVEPDVAAVNPCSVVVEMWEETGTKKNEEKEQDKEYEPYGGLNIFGVDLDDFPLPPGCNSFDQAEPSSTLSTPCPSPTSTVCALPTPACSPTPTIVDTLSPPPSRAAKRRLAQKEQSDVLFNNLHDYKLDTKHILARRGQAEDQKKLDENEHLKKAEKTTDEFRNLQVPVMETPRMKNEEWVPEAPLKKSYRRDGKRYSWEDREVFSPIASRPPATPPKVDGDDKYTPIPVRRHRAAIRARALAMQAPRDDDLGPLPVPAFKLQPEVEADNLELEAVQEVPLPIIMTKEEGQDQKKQRSAFATLLDRIREVWGKVFGGPENACHRATLST